MHTHVLLHVDCCLRCEGETRGHPLFGLVLSLSLSWWKLRAKLFPSLTLEKRRKRKKKGLFNPSPPFAIDIDIVFHPLGFQSGRLNRFSRMTEPFYLDHLKTKGYVYIVYWETIKL